MDPSASLGFSAERLAKIDRFLAARYVDPGILPGVQLLIARRGQVVHEAQIGLADVERRTPVSLETVFRIYSMTKPVAAVALMSLVEEGAIALDDPVSRYIPAWSDLKVAGPGGTLVAPGRPMQVVDLLRHTSGLTYSLQGRTDIDAAYARLGLDDFHGGLDLDGMIAGLADLPLEFSPGEAWIYSVSTDVVGYLAQKVADQPLDEVFRTRIFEPLGMDDTGFFVREDQRSRFAACYKQGPDGRIALMDDPQDSRFLQPPSMLSGGAGLVSTGPDYLAFANMLAAGGRGAEARILAPATVRLMAANHLPGGADLTQMSRSLFSESTNAGIGFGLGVAVAFDPVKALLPSTPGEFYWGGAASTAFWVDPAHEISVVLMTQFMPSLLYPIRRELRTLVYAALTSP